MAAADILDFFYSVSNGIFEHCQMVRCYGKILKKIGS
jgi:hypothetical protein